MNMAVEKGTKNPEIENQLKKLDEVNTEINAVVEQLVDEEAALHAKYELKKAPLYKKRQEIIKQIPNFWLTSLENHPIIASLIEMEDAEAIAYLEDIEIERSKENPINYKISFIFNENPYFATKTLKKEFDFSNKGNAKITNYKIDWKEGKDLTSSAKKTDGSETSDAFSEDEDSSFFCWFTDDNGSELADLIANDLFPNAGTYFSGTSDFDDEDDTPVFEMDNSDPEDDRNASDPEDAPNPKRAKRD